ncbi:MAG: hypothetical protein OZSIB_3486 [Candidatus Ozemobacter sibiricus]|uniref:Intracellular proteinase inhibitor BsuPI domain-containing protein n=1 Tax=Candidatus Ozemobacter sibiricus TaxID=2268124 RepID=A0A367ZQ81_9BACT|nr:MAG: hypothetical protein OZSIB_3486 [Candidatus Ozemobacter sibiricus]
MYHRGMKRAIFALLLLISLLPPSPVAAGWRDYRKWEYINPQDLEIRIIPEELEVIAGQIATFTISIRNKTDKPVHLSFDTGQRFDLAVWHNEWQIYRWSQGKRWAEAPHSIPIRPGVPETYQIAWQTVDRLSCPLPQDIYKVVGIVMTKPRALMTNTARIRLVPPKLVPGQVVKVRLMQAFELDLPLFLDQKPVEWHIDYDYNDNRVDLIGERRTVRTVTYVFEAKRAGHVMMHLYARPLYQNLGRGVERRSYRIEVVSGGE